MGILEILKAVEASGLDWEHFYHKLSTFSLSVLDHPQCLASRLNVWLFLTFLRTPGVQSVETLRLSFYNWLGLLPSFLAWVPHPQLVDSRGVGFVTDYNIRKLVSYISVLNCSD